jgi:hypothetical protein
MSSASRHQAGPGAAFGGSPEGRSRIKLREISGGTVKRLIALITGLALVSAASGAMAQGPSTTTPKEDKKTEKPAETKKPTAQNASGVVRAAAVDSLGVAGKAKGGKDTEWTFAVDPKTKIRKAGKDIAAGDLAAGDTVMVRYHDQGGKHVADSVMVQAAKKAAADAPKADTPKKDETKK